MTFPLSGINAGPVPAKVNLPAAAGQTFATLQLVGVTNAANYGKAGYAAPFSTTNNPSGGDPLISYAAGVNLGAQPGTSGSFAPGAGPSTVYQPLVTPGSPDSSADGDYSVNILQGGVKLLGSTATPANYVAPSIATTGNIVYSNDGQSCLCFPTQADANAVGYVIAGIQMSFSDAGDGEVEVLCWEWLNALLATITS